ncbi:hypothetical protein PG984_005249 [Apiospora sp. TS-2023a]
MEPNLPAPTHSWWYKTDPGYGRYFGRYSARKAVDDYNGPRRHSSPDALASSPDTTTQQVDNTSTESPSPESPPLRLLSGRQPLNLSSALAENWN